MKMNEDELPAYAQMLMRIYKVPLEDMTAAWDVVKDIDMRLVANVAKASGGKVGVCSYFESYFIDEITED